MANKFRIDTSEVKKLPEEIHAGLRVGMLKAAKFVEAIMKEEAPVGQGSAGKSGLRSSIVGDTEESGTVIKGIVTVNAKTSTGKPYPEFVAFGTGIYGPRKQPIPISPKNKKALSFTYLGKSVVAKSAKVKGMKPNPFHERAIVRAEPMIPEKIQEGLKESGAVE